jgi:NAD(P)-dependent dehydrogenase (short-subunit alcohol dehydrogenase family)
VSGPSFAGRLAVITGGGSGIGRATALAFAERGARVVVCDVDLDAAKRTAELASLLGPASDAHRVDIADSRGPLRPEPGPDHRRGQSRPPAQPLRPRAHPRRRPA